MGGWYAPAGNLRRVGALWYGDGSCPGPDVEVVDVTTLRWRH